MNIKVLTFSAVIAAVLILNGCKDAGVSKAAYELSKSTIQLPSEVSMVDINGDIIDTVAFDPVPKLILYIDSTECRMCRIAKLNIYQHLYEQSLQGKFQLVIMTGELDNESVPISTLVSDLCLNVPVYIDRKDVFREQNPAIPDDDRLHSFLIGTDNQVLFIGDPSSSKHLNTLFLSKLSQL